MPVKPVSRDPLPDMICVLDTTPYLENLEAVLEKCLERPPTIYEQQRHLVSTNGKPFPFRRFNRFSIRS